MAALSSDTSGLSAEARSEPTLLFSASGTSGTERDGLFQFDDPRRTFTLPADRQIVVYFEWDGSPGSYSLEGRWKDATGTVVLSAPLEYKAVRSRFGVRWSLALPDSVVTGLWALEVHLAGRAIGTHTFEIHDPRSVPVEPGEIYRLAIARAVEVERHDEQGRPIGRAPGFILADERVVTSFAAIEGAAALALSPPGGPRIETREVVAWNRREGWAVVRAATKPAAAVRAGADLAVGKRVFALDVAQDGTRIIGETSVVGLQPVGRGQLYRLAAAFAAGAPLFDAQGRLAAVVGGQEWESLGPVPIFFGSPNERPLPRGVVAVPLELLGPQPTRRTTLADLAARGVFLRPLSQHRRHVISGVFASRVDRSGDIPTPVDQRATFSRHEESFSVFVQWAPDEKLDVTASFAVYDDENRGLARSGPKTLKLRKGRLFFSTAVFPIAPLEPGTYRIDLLLDDEPAWRGFFEVRE